MYVIMGGTGHVGSAVVRALLKRGEQVTVVARDASKAQALQAEGASVVEADAEDVDSLRAAFRRGRRAFLLNPPADTSKDTDAIERRTVANIIAALDGSGLEKVVAQSTYGVQPGERIGDLSVLWELEEGLRHQSIPAAINRGAYYYSNWDSLLGEVRKSGSLPTMLPADLAIPMVAPSDLGRAAAERLVSDLDDVGIRYVEGPEHYSVNDVAAVFARVLNREVRVTVIPRDEWQATYLKLGFSHEAADSYGRMTAVSVDSTFEIHDHPWRWPTTLEEHLRVVAEGSEE